MQVRTGPLAPAPLKHSEAQFPVHGYFDSKQSRTALHLASSDVLLSLHALHAGAVPQTYPLLMTLLIQLPPSPEGGGSSASMDVAPPAPVAPPAAAPSAATIPPELITLLVETLPPVGTPPVPFVPPTPTAPPAPVLPPNPTTVDPPVDTAPPAPTIVPPVSVAPPLLGVVVKPPLLLAKLGNFASGEGPHVTVRTTMTSKTALRIIAITPYFSAKVEIGLPVFVTLATGRPASRHKLPNQCVEVR
jgi:hypothetical protein